MMVKWQRLWCDDDDEDGDSGDAIVGDEMVTVMMTMVVRVEEGLEREDWGLIPD